jgi:hypothetical protein
MGVGLGHSIIAYKSTLQGISKLQVCNIIQNYAACFLQGARLSIHSAQELLSDKWRLLIYEKIIVTH